MTAKELVESIKDINSQISDLKETKIRLERNLENFQRNCSHERAIQTGRAVGQMGVGHVPYRFKCPDCLATYVK